MADPSRVDTGASVPDAPHPWTYHEVQHLRSVNAGLRAELHDALTFMERHHLDMEYRRQRMLRREDEASLNTPSVTEET